MGYTITSIAAQYQRRNNLQSNMLCFIGRIHSMIAKQTIYKCTMDVGTLEDIFIQAYNGSNSNCTFTVSIAGVSAGTVVIGNATTGNGTVDISGNTGNKELKIEINTAGDDKIVTEITVMHQEA